MNKFGQKLKKMGSNTNTSLPLLGYHGPIILSIGACLVLNLPEILH